MDVPMSWLKTFVPMDKPTSVFVEDITLSGSKVEAVRKLGAELSNVAVGRVLSLKKHENSDHLLVARVDAGSVVLQIVTGAPNIFEGALVPVALDGATLSGGAVIRTGRLRGELSEGMMCSIQELGHTPAEYPEAPEDGIYIFAEDSGVKPGDDALAALMLKDEVVEFEITSNRPDCFSVIGIARETAATYGLPLTLPEVRVRESAGGNIPDMISVEIQNPALCPRYIARALKNVRLAPSPLWMRQRLMACGVRPINNIVDITNYVMLEYGQPMHAFDIDNIARRKIIVRNARDGEVFTTLDGTARVLDASMLVIADPEKAVAIAGIMGGENSMVTENAAGILFEAACFDGTNVRLTSKKLGLRTDSSAKFEKGLDPNLALEAMNRACALAEELGCGEVVPGALDCYPRKREKKRVPFSAQRVNRLLGLERNGRPLTGNEMAALLERLEIRVENAGADGGDPGLCAVAPTFRPDIEIEADIAEEVARLYGYDRIEPTLTAGAPSVGRKTERQIMDDAVRNCMSAMGFHEAL
ncbi:MAG: phenylalanine--tRNA ligase subunit beta, partial [Firmicutes bacterium]|nr:phenylalanine--tRNA ligase subunit beta [Bacillota bacterium]